MAKNKGKLDFCPACGKAEISREPAGKINYDAGGWNEKCPYCGTLLWVPADRTKPIEVVVIPVFGFPPFEPEEIIFSSEIEIRLLEAMSERKEGQDVDAAKCPLV